MSKITTVINNSDKNYKKNVKNNVKNNCFKFNKFCVKVTINLQKQVLSKEGSEQQRKWNLFFTVAQPLTVCMRVGVK